MHVCLFYKSSNLYRACIVFDDLLICFIKSLYTTFVPIYKIFLKKNSANPIVTYGGFVLRQSKALYGLAH